MLSFSLVQLKELRISYIFWTFSLGEQAYSPKELTSGEANGYHFPFSLWSLGKSRGDIFTFWQKKPGGTTPSHRIWPIEQSKQFLDRASGRLTVWNFYQSTSNPNTRTLKTAVTLIDLHKCPSYINCYLEVFLFVFHNLTSNKGRCLVSALVYGSSGLGSSPCAVLLGKTLYSHCVTLHQGV